MPANNSVKRFLLVLMLGVAAAAAGYGVYVASRADGTTPRRPDFKLSDLDGKPHSVSEWDGKLLLINFWAPWCEPCRKEMPMLIQLQKDLGPRGLQILGLALDEPAVVRRFSLELGVNYPVLVGLTDIIRIQDAFGDSRLPFSVLIDRRGQVVYSKAGELGRSEIENALKPLL